MVKDTSLKKKRRSAGPENELEVDIYKRVIDYEDKEASNRECGMDAKIYFDVCTDIREMLKEIHSQKMQGSATQSPNKEMQTDILVKLCILKKLNRIDKIRHVVGRETLTAEKQKCDSIKLSYQNLLYELHHLVAETNKCMAFKSKDEDIELVSLEEFMKDAPEPLSKRFEKCDPSHHDQSHNLRLARLEWELAQRKNFAQLCKALEQEQKNLEGDLLGNKEKLNMLKPLLSKILETTRPLQQHLGISFSELRIEHNLAHLLADPLYMFYVNVVSYKSAFNLSLDVEINGDRDEAVMWREMNESKENSLLDDESDQEPDQVEVEEVVEVKKRRHRKSVQQVDPMEEKKRKLLTVHPLSVEITAKVNSGLSLAIKFCYHPKLKMITVTSKTNIPPNITGPTACDILCGENILGELMKGDSGLNSPNPVTIFQIKKVGITSFQALVPQIGHAYNWAQRVCGMDFITNKMSDEETCSNSVEKVINALLKRMKSRSDLANQLQQLDQNTLPVLPSNLSCPTSQTCLKKWSTITYQKYCQSSFTQQYVEEELVLPYDSFYSAELTRGVANLQALIVLKNNFPAVRPLFSLCLNFNGTHHSKNNDAIRDMEQIVNLDCGKDDPTSWVLSLQLAYLCSYLDVYLETTDTKAFPQTTTFIRRICGRNRRRPFRFRNMGNGIFSQY